MDFGSVLQDTTVWVQRWQRLVFLGYTDSWVNQHGLTVKGLSHGLGGGSILWWINWVIPNDPRTVQF